MGTLNPIEITRSTIDGVAYFWRRRGSFRSLCAFVLFLTISLSLAVTPLYYFLKSAKIISTPDSLLRFALSAVSGIGLCNLLLIVAWFYWRSIPRISPRDIGVFFAPYAEPDCEDIIFSLYEQFKRDLKARGLSGLVTHSLLPRNYAVANHDDAHKLLIETGARLVVFGSVHRGKVKDKLVEGFRTISFTVRHRQLDSKEIMPVATTLAGALALRSFVFPDTESFIEKGLVIENISDVACFFIAMAFALDGRAEESVTILEYLLAQVSTKKKLRTHNPQLDLFHNSVIDCLTYAYGRQLFTVYDSYLVDHITRREFDEYASRYERILIRLFELSRDARQWSLSRAVLDFHYGKIPEAKKRVGEAKGFFPKTNAAPRLSAAFLALWEGFYATALREYLQASRCTEFDPGMIVGVIRFLASVIEAYPEKKQLRFGLAFVNDRFFDRSAAKREYVLFIQNTESMQEKGLNLLRENARLRLLELEGQETSREGLYSS